MEPDQVAPPTDPERPVRHTLFWMDMTREGGWTVPATTEIRGTRTNVRLDLTEAVFAAPEVAIDLALYNSGAEIVVGPDVDVVVQVRGVSAPEPPTVRPDGEDPQLVVISGYSRLLGKGVRIVRA